MASMAIPEELLAIPDVEVETIETTASGEVIITVHSTKKGTKCRKCGRWIEKCHGHDDPILLRHLSLFGRKVYLRVCPARYQCLQCHRRPTTTERVSWRTPRSDYTLAYEKHILWEFVNSTVEDVSVKEDIGYDAIMGILDRHIRGKVDWNQVEAFDVLGLDDLSLKKGHRDFVTIVTGRKGDTITILSILPNRKKATVKRFLNRMPRRFRRRITTVCSDMYTGFINAVKEVLGRCVIVVDRFHVAKNYRAVLDRVRKQELKRLKSTLSASAYKKLKGVMWMLRKPKEALTKPEALTVAFLFCHSPLLEQVYTACQELTAIFDAPLSKRDAMHHIIHWKLQVKRQGLTCFRTFLTTLDTYLHEITHYFFKRQTSGFVEGFNNKLKVLKRRCYGIVNVTHFYQRIVLDLEGYLRFAYIMR